MKIVKSKLKYKVEKIISKYHYEIIHLDIIKYYGKDKHYKLILYYKDSERYSLDEEYICEFKTYNEFDMIKETLEIKLQDERGLNWIRRNLRIIK